MSEHEKVPNCYGSYGFSDCENCPYAIDCIYETEEQEQEAEEEIYAQEGEE